MYKYSFVRFGLIQSSTTLRGSMADNHELKVRLACYRSRALYLLKCLLCFVTHSRFST